MTPGEGPLPFWFDDGSPAKGASAGSIAAFEEHTGKALPVSLKRLLLERDGGVSNYEAYHVDERCVPLPAFFSIETMTRSFDTAHHFGTPDGVIAVASGAHDWLGLDYRTSHKPSVVFQEHEDAPLQWIANSFDDFLEGLGEE